ncbi:MAG: hypothetical protein WA294_21035 [Acidobacteriaceae bacterium]
MTSSCLEQTDLRAHALAARRVSDAPMRWFHCACYFCLVLSVPWSIWVTSGWIGLLIHFQTAAGGAWLLERLLRGRPFRKTA